MSERIFDDIRPSLTFRDFYAAWHALEVSLSGTGRCQDTKCLKCNPLLAAAQELVDSEG